MIWYVLSSSINSPFGSAYFIFAFLLFKLVYQTLEQSHLKLGDDYVSSYYFSFKMIEEPGLLWKFIVFLKEKYIFQL